MPAHTSASSIGQKMCSDGMRITEDLWSANQIVDQLAKDAPGTVRTGGAQRDWLCDREKQLKELVIFLGKLTHAANASVVLDGTQVRDDCCEVL